MVTNEILNYFYNNMDKFTVCEKEIQKTSRERKLLLKGESKNYILNFFKSGLQSVLNEKEDSFLFSISMNTAVLMHKSMYMHIQIYDDVAKKPSFIIKSLRECSDFSIHNFKNQGLTITNHLLARYIKYFKKFISWKEKELHQDTLEREIMIKLKSGKTTFSKLLTDTVYLVVDDMYFVLKVNGKNTISLVTMRPYSKILELPIQLKRKIKDTTSYKRLISCEISGKVMNYSDEDLLSSNDKLFISKSEARRKYKKFNYDDFKLYGKAYLKLIKEVPNRYVKGYSFNELLEGMFIYVEAVKNKTASDDKCVCCNKEIGTKEFYDRNHNDEKIHKECAHSIIDIKSTSKIFLHSGLNGLKATAKQQEEQMKSA